MIDTPVELTKEEMIEKFVPEYINALKSNNVDKIVEMPSCLKTAEERRDTLAALIEAIGKDEDLTSQAGVILAGLEAALEVNNIEVNVEAEGEVHVPSISTTDPEVAEEATPSATDADTAETEQTA